MFFLYQLSQLVGFRVQCANTFFSVVALSPGFDHVSRRAMELMKSQRGRTGVFPLLYIEQTSVIGFKGASCA